MKVDLVGKIKNTQLTRAADISYCVGPRVTDAHLLAGIEPGDE